MNKRKLQNGLAFLLAMALVMISCLPAFAEGPETDAPVGEPKIALINGPVFEARPGEENEVVIKIKNISSYFAKSILIQPEVVSEGNPFTVSFVDGKNRIDGIAPRSEKEITILVNVDKTAETKTYEMNLKYVFYNTGMQTYSGNDKIYIKIQNTAAAPNFVVENVKTDKTSISAGDTTNMSGVIRNIGPVNMFDVQVVLDGLDPAGISVIGVNSKRFDKILAGTRENFGFQIAANQNMDSGNYPVTMKMTYKDDAGKALEYTQQFFVNVGGTSPTTKPALEIRNMAEPSGTYGVNQNFPVTFELVNTGQATAKNVKVTATPIGEVQSVVPKSSSIQTVAELPAGQKKAFEFTFAPTSQSKSQNYSIEFLVEYEDGTKKEGVSNLVSFKQYVGANVSNPEGDKKDDDKDKKESKPKIIVSKYVCDPLIVMAGQEFDLTMTFLNTHPVKTAKNIKMFLTLSEETAPNTEKTGNIFTPVDASNTFYFDSLTPKATVDKKLRLFVVPDAQPKTYTLTVNFEYEDVEGNEFTTQELLGINVKQVTKLETGDIFVPEIVEAGMPVTVSFDLYNTGKVNLSNTMIRIEGDVEAPNKSTFFGNLESGNSEYYEGSFTAMAEGEVPVSIIVAYDDPSGEHFEEKHDFTMQVTAPAPMEDNGMGMEGEMMPPENPALKTIKIGAVVVVVAVVVLIIVVFIVKHKKAKAELAFLEQDEPEDINLSLKKGNDMDEHL